MRRLPPAALLLLATAAQAIPPDARLALVGQRPRIEKIDDGFLAVEVEPPGGVLRAELLPTGELLLEPRGAGVARVFLFARRLVRALEVAVDVPLPPSEAAPPPAGCFDNEGARITNEQCYRFWRARLEHAVAAEMPALGWEPEGLRAELKAAQAALDAAGLKMSASVSAFGLRLFGARDEADKRRALRAVWGAILGPLRLDE